jgi:hypothetical protein
MGPVRIRVSPRNAEVWVEGERVGVAAELNGFPDYLWLPEGTYDLALYSPGFETIAQQITVRRDDVAQISYRMRRGESLHPRDLVDPSTERRDQRLERDRERRDEAQRRALPPRRDDWRQRPPAPRPYPEAAERSVPERAPSPAPTPRPTPAPRPDIVSEPIDEVEIRAERLPDEVAAFGSLELAVSPEDASVYLDDSFLGTAAEIAAAEGGVLVEPGERVLQVVRPGYRSEERAFTARPGETVTVRIELEQH